MFTKGIFELQSLYVVNIWNFIQRILYHFKIFLTEFTTSVTQTQGKISSLSPSNVMSHSLQRVSEQ